MPLGNKDIYVNIAGGVKIDDPAADLAVAAAIASSLRDLPLEDEIIILGELGLLGEIRSIGQLPRRLKEGEAMGFNLAIIPHNQKEKVLGIKEIRVENIAKTMKILGLK